MEFEELPESVQRSKAEVVERISSKYMAPVGEEPNGKPVAFGTDPLGMNVTLSEDVDIPYPTFEKDEDGAYIRLKAITLLKGVHRVIDEENQMLIGSLSVPDFNVKVSEIKNSGGTLEGARFRLEAKPYTFYLNGVETPLSVPLLVMAYAMRDAEAMNDGGEEAARVFSLFYDVTIEGQRAQLGRHYGNTEPIEPMNQLGNLAAIADAIAHGIGDVKHVMSSLSKTTASATNSNLNGCFYDEGGRPIRVSGNNEPEITTMLALSYDDGLSNAVQQLNEFDRLVHDGMATLWANNHKAFTVKQLTELIKGHKVEKKSECAMVEESVIRQWRTHVHMDFSEEMRGRIVPTDDGVGVAADDGSEIEMTAVNIAKIKIPTTDGKRCEAYVMMTPPVFYQHDKAVGQITTYPRRLLEADTGKNATKDTLVLQTAIIRRIARMKHRGAKSQRSSDRRIRYLTLMKESGLVAYNEDTADSDIEVSKVKASRVREKVSNILNALKREKYIKDWNEYTVGRRKEGVEIVL